MDIMESQIHLKINYRVEIKNISLQSKQGLAIDVNMWGVSEPFSDPENITMYRDTLFELSNDTFNDELDYPCQPHYENAPTGSIWDY